MFRNSYRLSSGANRSFLKASFFMTLFNLASLLPVVLLALVTNEMLNRYFGDASGPIPLWTYWGAALVLLTVIFVTYKITYRKKYSASGKEDMRLRMELADKIRRLPLS